MTNWMTIAKVLGSALGLLAQIIQQRGNEETRLALMTLGHLLRAVETGDLSNIDPAKARAELDKLVVALAHRDQAADAALAKRFPDEEN